MTASRNIRTFRARQSALIFSSVISVALYSLGCWTDVSRNSTRRTLADSLLASWGFNFSLDDTVGVALRQFALDTNDLALQLKSSDSISSVQLILPDSLRPFQTATLSWVRGVPMSEVGYTRARNIALYSDTSDPAQVAAALSAHIMAVAGSPPHSVTCEPIQEWQDSAHVEVALWDARKFPRENRWDRGIVQLSALNRVLGQSHGRVTVTLRERPDGFRDYGRPGPCR